MYVKRNTEARSCNHCYGGRTMSMIQPVCICSLRYPTCNAHAPHCHLWPAPIYNISTLSHKRHDFRKTIIEHQMCVSSFYTTFVWNSFHSKKNWARYGWKYILVFV